MVTFTQKQMLVLSVQGQGTDSPYLKFEIEPYYRLQTRRIHTERALTSFESCILLADESYIEDLGYVLILGLLVGEMPKYKDDPAWAQLVYPHERNGNPVLRIDEEYYEHKPHRIFCTAMPLPTLDMDVASGDEALKRKIARTVLQHLPLRCIET